jgi:hypothetical protein
MVSLRRGLVLFILLMAGAVAIIALPGPAHAADGCDEQPLSRPFLPWLDLAWYTPVPDAWTLDDGAAVAADNGPLGGAPAVSLPAGSSATTAPLCVSLAHPTVRFFARNTGSRLSALAVSVVFDGGSLPVGVIGAGDSWAPSPVLPVVANLLSRDVAFRFTPLDARGEWTIDDVFVDPYKKG